MYSYINHKWITCVQTSTVCLRRVVVLEFMLFFGKFQYLNRQFWFQIYVEIERARLTKTLATIKEQNGEVKEAASILQELQVTCYATQNSIGNLWAVSINFYYCLEI